MRFTGIANSEQLGVLCQALEQYCAAHKVTDNDERENVASLIVWLFGRGVTGLDEIVAALEETLGRNKRRQS